MGFQGHKLNILLTRHTLSKPRLGYHKMPPGDILFGNSTKNSGDNIKDLVEGNFSKPAEKRPIAVWPPARPGSAGDDGRRHGSTTAANRDDVQKLVTYGYGRIMGEGREHNYAPAQNKKMAGKLPVPRATLSSTLKAQAALAPLHAPARPRSAKEDPNWKLAEFTRGATPRTRLDGFPLNYEEQFPDRARGSTAGRSTISSVRSRPHTARAY